MILVRCPCRISLFGGGTDFPNYYNEYGGIVVAITISNYVNIIVNKRFNNEIRVSYSKNEIVKDVEEIQHSIAKELLKYFNIKKGIEIVSVSDITGLGKGLGSSSAYTIGLAQALNLYKTGSKLEPEDLAKIACEIEIEKLGKPIGKQDQYTIAFGGMNKIEFTKDNIKINKVGIPIGLEKYLVLLDTNTNRESDSILEEQNKNIRNNLNVLHMMKNYTLSAYQDILENNMIHMGLLLDEYWNLKKKLSKNITNDYIDSLYNQAKENGAIGSKIAGAGGGGVLVSIVRPEDRTHFIKSMGLKVLDVKLGSKIETYTM